MSNAELRGAANPSSKADSPSPGGSKFGKLALWTVGILAGACGVLAIIGMLLPDEYSVERSIVVKAKPFDVHSQIVDLKTWPKWNAEHPDRQYQFPGQTQGEGAVQTWSEPNKPDATMTITWENPHEGIQYTVLLDGDEEPLKCSIRYEPTADGTQVTWRTRGKLGNNPIDRWRGLLMEGNLGPELETGLENLKPLAEQRADENRKRALEAAKLAVKLPLSKARGSGGRRGRGKSKTGGRGRFGGPKKRPPTDGSSTPAKNPPAPREDKKPASN
jgi:Polyketide cyclase / dehydrase and lipid transport